MARAAHHEVSARFPLIIQPQASNTKIFMSHLESKAEQLAYAYFRCLKLSRNVPMTHNSHIKVVSEFYDAHPINEQQILEKLEQDDVDTSQLSEDTLQNYDQDHFGGV